MKLKEFVQMYKNCNLDALKERSETSDSEEQGPTYSFSPEETQVARKCYTSYLNNVSFEEAVNLLSSYAKKNNILDYDLASEELGTANDCSRQLESAIFKVQKSLGFSSDDQDGIMGRQTVGALKTALGQGLKKKKKLEVEPEDVVEPEAVNVPTAAVTVSDDTISIIGHRWRYGSRKSGRNVIPGIINAVDVHTPIAASGLFTMDSYRAKKRWGNPVMIGPMIAAAKFASQFSKRKDGVIRLCNAGLQNGGPSLPHTSHQTGLDMDTTHYRNDGVSAWQNSNAGFRRFDVPRNVAFMYYLLVKSGAVHRIFSDNTLNGKISAYLKRNSMPEISKMWQATLSTGKLNHVSGHADHYHIRFNYPANSMTLPQLIKKYGQQKADELILGCLAGLEPGGVQSVVSKDSLYRKYARNKTAIAKMKLRKEPTITTTAARYNLGPESWKASTEKVADLIRVRPESISNFNVASVQNLQRKLGLGVDGIVGGDTLTALAYLDALADNQPPELVAEQSSGAKAVNYKAFISSKTFIDKIKSIFRQISAKFSNFPEPSQLGLTKKPTAVKVKAPTKGNKYTIDIMKQKFRGNIGYAIGTVDGRIIESHNLNKLFYGASSQKTMAGLVQLIKYESEPRKQLSEKELQGLLTYRRRWQGRGIPGGKGFPYAMGSNEINKAIAGRRDTVPVRDKTGKIIRYKTWYKRRNLGTIRRSDISSVAKNFGVEGNKWRYGDNYQTPKDYFNFFATLTRMYTGKSEGEEREYYEQHKQSIDKIVEIQKQNIGTYQSNSGYRKYTGVFDSDTKLTLLKGGAAQGALNWAFVLEDKYVVVFFTKNLPPQNGPIRYSNPSRRRLNTFATLIKELVDKVKGT